MIDSTRYLVSRNHHFSVVCTAIYSNDLAVSLNSIFLMQKHKLLFVNQLFNTLDILDLFLSYWLLFGTFLPCYGIAQP